MHSRWDTELISKGFVLECTIQPIGVACYDVFTHEHDGSIKLIIVRECAVENCRIEDVRDMGDGRSIRVGDPELHQSCEAWVVAYPGASKDNTFIELMTVHDLDALIK